MYNTAISHEQFTACLPTYQELAEDLCRKRGLPINDKFRVSIPPIPRIPEPMDLVRARVSIDHRDRDLPKGVQYAHYGLHVYLGEPGDNPTDIIERATIVIHEGLNRFIDARFKDYAHA